ncbi:MAG: class D sortase [Thermoanaerobaculia bacterium]
MTERAYSDFGKEATRSQPCSRFPVLCRWLRRIEFASLTAGSALLLVFVSARLHSQDSRQLQLAAFDLACSGPPGALAEPAVDQSLWSAGRIAKYCESLGQLSAPPLAVLRIPRIGLEVPVLAGTDEFTLNRAVGNIAGTAAPGEPGNVGIAGHRDGFFRGLKDLEVGDRLEIETLKGRQGYVVTTIRIVDPTEVQVLDPTPMPALTLVTCYPFYYVGKAPQRFIVQAQPLPDACEEEVLQR